MIDSNMFMEFFEKEFGIIFIDQKSGKTREELIAEKEAKKNCMNCYWSESGGTGNHPDDIICVNAESDSTADFVYNDMKCPQWKKNT
jgi:hypothetical protein